MFKTVHNGGVATEKNKTNRMFKMKTKKEAIDNVKNAMEMSKLYIKLATVKTVEFGVKGILKTEKLAKNTIEFSKQKLNDLNEWFAKNNYSKNFLQNKIISYIVRD